MKNKIQITAVIILSLLIASAGTLWAKYEPQEDLIDFYKKQGKTEATVEAYHERMNELFNDKTELLITKYDEKAVDEAPKDGEPCTEENVSTYCVAETAVNEYFAFQEVLLEHRTKIEIPEKPEEEADGDTAGKQLISDLAELQSQRLRFIDEELDVGYEVMDLTLKAYNELHRAYPLHKKYEEIKKELIQYRDMMAEVRHQVEFFPTKFIDVSTTSCT
jgi:hypothetical protein